MDYLKNKSEINLQAAEMLHKSSVYPPVAHCSYYSCFQYMKHIWLNIMGKTESDLSVLVRNSTEGSHEVLINQLVTHVKNKSQDSRTFNTTILQLKKLRHKADYENIEIDSTLSSNSISLSKSSLIILKKCL